MASRKALTNRDIWIVILLIIAIALVIGILGAALRVPAAITIISGGILAGVVGIVLVVRGRRIR